MSAVQIQFTTPDEALGHRIADVLVDERLAACAQSLGPITSTYWWRGTKETAAEWLFVCKTSASRFAAAAARITELHTYEVPEIIAVPIVDATPDYLAWIEAETRVT